MIRDEIRKKEDKGNLYTKVIGVRQETQTLGQARITLWYKVDEIILFFSLARLDRL